MVNWELEISEARSCWDELGVVLVLGLFGSRNVALDWIGIGIVGIGIGTSWHEERSRE
jgi:hypothetical protein